MLSIFMLPYQNNFKEISKCMNLTKKKQVTVKDYRHKIIYTTRHKSHQLDLENLGQSQMSYDNLIHHAQKVYKFEIRLL